MLIVSIVLLFISNIILRLKGQKCSIKRCSSSNNINLPGNQCIWAHEENKILIYDIQSNNCKTNEKCIFFNNFSNITCQKIEKVRGLPGDKCELNDDCWSNICSENECIGKPANTLCEKHEECKIHYFCGLEQNSNTTAKKCLVQLDSNKKCMSDYECESDKGCYKDSTLEHLRTLTLDEIPGLCTKYLSLEDGTSATTDQVIFCKSHFIHNNQCVSTDIKSNELCQFGQDKCQYSYLLNSTKNNFTMNCTCSDSYDDKLFCPMATSNFYWKEYIKQLKLYYGCSAFKKHTLNRHNLDINLNLMRQETINFPKLKDADLCYKYFVASTRFINTFSISIILLILLYI